MNLETILAYGECAPLLTYFKLPCSAFPSLYVIFSQVVQPLSRDVVVVVFVCNFISDVITNYFH